MHNISSPLISYSWGRTQFPALKFLLTKWSPPPFFFSWAKGSPSWVSLGSCPYFAPRRLRVGRWKHDRLAQLPVSSFFFFILPAYFADPTYQEYTVILTSLSGLLGATSRPGHSSKASGAQWPLFCRARVDEYVWAVRWSHKFIVIIVCQGRNVGCLARPRRCAPFRCCRSPLPRLPCLTLCTWRYRKDAYTYIRSLSAAARLRLCGLPA